MTDIEVEAARVRRDSKIAEASAKQATEDAQDYATGAQVDYTSAVELEESAAAAAKRGDTKQAEEDTELAAHYRGGAKRYEQQEREATLEAAKYREEAAGHDVRAKELHYEMRDTNGLHSAAEKQLDNLEERARLYEEANRKFDEADGANGSVSAPMRRRLQNEAQAAIDKADAIEIDRAAIRVLAPDFPEQTPGFDAAVSSVAPSDGDADPTALAFAENADDDPGTEPDLGLDDGADAQPASDPLEPLLEPSSAVASADATEETGDVAEFAFDTPEPTFADGGSDVAFGAIETFAEHDFASTDAPAESFGADPDSSFADGEFT